MINAACTLVEADEGVAATISCRSLRGSKPVAAMNCRNPLSLNCICARIYCPKGDATLWSTFMPETTVASGMTRFSRAGVTPAVAVAAARDNVKTVLYKKVFIREPQLHSTSNDGGGSRLLQRFSARHDAQLLDNVGKRLRLGGHLLAGRGAFLGRRGRPLGHFVH